MASYVVFPAYAGVIREYDVRIVVYYSIPRVCGGDPVSAKQRKQIMKYSPRMRG